MTIKASKRLGAHAAIALAVGGALLAPAFPAAADTEDPVGESPAPAATEEAEDTPEAPAEVTAPPAETTVPEEVTKSIGDFVAFFAAQGPGYGTWDDSIGWQGGFGAPDGSIVYCIEPGNWNPSGDSVDGGWQDNVVSSSPHGTVTLNADQQARIGRIVAEYGQTWNNSEAAAVSFAVKAVANTEAMYASHGYTGPHTLAGYVNWVLYSQVGGSVANDIAARAQQILDETEFTTAGPTLGSGSVNFAVDSKNNYKGNVSVSIPGAPAGVSYTITLTNGVFTTTGTNTLTTTAPLGTKFDVRGVAPENGADYKISGSAQISSGYSGQLHVWLTGDKQKTAGPGRTSSYTAEGFDPGARSTDFQPQAISAAPRFAKPGDPLLDTATFQIAPDANGRVNEWFRNSKGDYAPTDWTIEAYAVDKAPEEATSEVPEGAELIASTTYNTGTAGPNAKGRATFGDAVMPEDGRAVVYIWKFDASTQPERFRAVFGEGYLWTDLFGLAEETTFGVDVTTKAQVATKKGATSYDTAIVTGVLPNEGLELSFEKYVVPMKQDESGKWIPDAPEGTEPGDLTWVCEIPGGAGGAASGGAASSNLVADNHDEPLHITEAGEYKSPEFPADKYGTELWVEELATVPDEDGNQVIVDRGECAEPSETTHVIDVKTQAYSDSGAGTSARGDDLWDVAEIRGSVPEGATVTFQAFQVQTGSELVCTAETLVWTSEPVALEAGVWMDEDPQLAASGTFSPEEKPFGVTTTFVETTTTEDGDELSRGECGEPTETLTTPPVPPAGGNLAQTGGTLDPLWVGVGGSLLAGGLLAYLLPILRRRRAMKTVDAPSAD